MAFQTGEDIVGYFKAESTYATAVKPAATDAFLTNSFEITPNYDRPIVPDRRNTRSVQETVAGRKSCGWSCGGTLRASGTAGTQPDIGDILKHTFGTETIVSSTSVKYVLLKDPSALSASIYKKMDDILEGVYGAVVQSLTLNFSADDFATWEASGIGQEYLAAGVNAANGAGSSTTALVVDDGTFYEKYGIIKIGSEDNSGAGIQITAVSGTAVTLESTFSWSDNAAVIPFVPAGTFVGDPRYGTVGQFSLDGGSTSFPVTGGSVSVATGIGLHEREYGKSVPQAVVLPEARGVTFSFNILVSDTNFNTITAFRRKTAQDVFVTIGDTTAKQLKIDMSRCECMPDALGGSEGLIEVNISGQALTSTTSATEDEINLMFD
jgi:hypothetical protein